MQADGKTKRPYYITTNDQEIFGFAGLWDRSKRDDGTRVESCAIVTMPANKLMSEIYNAKQRMPAILAREDRDAWLKGATVEAFAALKQYPDTHLVATPVSTRVNAPKNNDDYQGATFYLSNLGMYSVSIAMILLLVWSLPA